MIICRTAQIHHAIERSLYEIEWIAEDFRGQFLDSFESAIGRSQLTENNIGLAVFPNHLQGPFLSGKNR